MESTERTVLTENLPNGTERLKIFIVFTILIRWCHQTPALDSSLFILSMVPVIDGSPVGEHR